MCCLCKKSRSGIKFSTLELSASLKLSLILSQVKPVTPSLLHSFYC